MARLTPSELIEFARDIGRPPEDPETMYRQPQAPSAPAPEPVSDPINPSHYQVGGIETIDYMRAKSTPEEFEGYLRLSALKYLSRVGHKHGDHDAARVLAHQPTATQGASGSCLGRGGAFGSARGRRGGDDRTAADRPGVPGRTRRALPATA